MSLVDSFLTGGNPEVDATFGVSSMVADGQTFNVVFNDERTSYEGALGGLESPVQATATAQPSHVTNPKGLLQKRCTVGGTSYRIAEVQTGTVAVHFVLTDPNESR